MHVMTQSKVFANRLCSGTVIGAVELHEVHALRG